jgi:hypothetical protein
MRKSLKGQIDKPEEVLQAFIDDNLDLLRLRQVAYLAIRGSYIARHEKTFMQKYRANRNSQFESIRDIKPPPLDAIKTLGDARKYTAKQWDTKYKGDLGSEFWRDELARWEGGNIRSYAESQGKRLTPSKSSGEYRPSLMPAKIPKEYINADTIYDSEEKLRA